MKSNFEINTALVINANYTSKYSLNKMNKFSTKPIHLTIKVPFERMSFAVVAYEGQTLFDIIDNSPDLKTFFECSCGGELFVC